MSQLPTPAADTSRLEYDPGLTQQYTGALKRAVNADGQFNVHRKGGTWRDVHLYLYLINVSWPMFFVLVALAFAVLNTAFAAAYMGIGIEHLKNAYAPTAEMRFVNAFFFSAHTLTTVGYGNIYPDGIGAELTSAFEALVGLLGFAIATGLMFGRFSRPSARFGFSERMLIAPYMGGTSLQFRIVNRRSNNLIEVEAQVMLMIVDFSGIRPERRFIPLELERKQVLFLPLTWTIVHPIAEGSPLYGKTPQDLEQLQAEIIVMIKAFDETFSQRVQARYSYRFDEILWGAKFISAFEIDKDGDLQLELNKISATTTAAPRG